MSVCPVVPSDVMPTAAEQAGLGLLGGAGMVAVRLGELRSPAGAGLGKDGRTALVTAGAAGVIGTGDVVVFCKPVAVAKAVVRRDGRVQAAGHPADHARLGVAEQQLDALAGPLIDEVAGSVELRGKVKGKARRALTAALVIRFTLLMTLIPDADYPEVLAALLGDLVGVPWQRPYQMPTATVLSTWRQAVGPEPLERLRERLLAAVGAEHHQHDWRAVRVGDLEVCAIDGSLVRTPDTPANRQAFGSAGTADDSAPYPQLRELRLSHASTRATLAVVTGPSGAAAGGERDKGEAEQVLLDKALTDAPGVFTPDRVWVMDRNFPGVPRIAAMLATGTHVLIRLKDGIKLPRQGAYARDHSYLATICGGGATLTVRVVEYNRHRRTVLPDHRPARRHRLPRRGPRRGLPLAVDRLRNHAQRSQIHHQRRRTVHRSDPPLGLPSPDRPRTRRVDHRRRTHPGRRPRRRHDRHPSHERTPRRPASTVAPDLLHRRPPRGHHHHPHRRGDRKPAHPPGHRQPAHHADRTRPPTRHPRPGPAPRTQDKGPPRLPTRRPTPAHLHRPSRDQHLQTAGRLSTPLPPVSTLPAAPPGPPNLAAYPKRHPGLRHAQPPPSHSVNTPPNRITTPHTPDQPELHGIGRSRPGATRSPITGASSSPSTR